MNLSKKVYILPANENWIVDNFVSEWSCDNQDMTTSNPFEADVIWLLASWCWRQVPEQLLLNKKVLATVHHIVPEKFDDSKRWDFLCRDKYVDAYHVYNQITYDFIRNFTDKPIYLLHYWANQKIWKKTESKESLRDKHNLPKNSFLIGSFQRDTEGHDLKSPKLEKGPDLFVNFIENIKNSWENWPYKLNRNDLHIVLAGWRRQYVISRLKSLSINYTYFELADQETLNELYQTLDLYPISSRHEGGPQALIECGLLDVPVVSRNVGIAQQVLLSESINDDIYLAIPGKSNVNFWKLPHGYEPYRKLIKEL